MQPVWPSFAELYRDTGESPTAIAWLANRGRCARHYRSTWVPKRHGRRLLEAPLPRLKHVQRVILERALQPVQPHRRAMGFVAGRGARDHAALHTGRRWVVSMDLRDFFATITISRVLGVFRWLGFSDGLAPVLAALTTNAAQITGPSSWQERRLYGERHLPQGAPTSPMLANLVAWRLDQRLDSLATRIGGSYSRYADDLVISHNAHYPSLVSTIGAIAMQEGFAVQFRKTRVMSSASRQMVTGLVVNNKPGLSRQARKQLEAMLFNCIRYGPASQDREGLGRAFRAHLQGRVAYAVHVDAGRSRCIQELFEQIDWEPKAAISID